MCQFNIFVLSIHWASPSLHGPKVPIGSASWDILCLIQGHKIFFWNEYLTLLVIPPMCFPSGVPGSALYMSNQVIQQPLATVKHSTSRIMLYLCGYPTFNLVVVSLFWMNSHLPHTESSCCPPLVSPSSAPAPNPRATN